MKRATSSARTAIARQIAHEDHVELLLDLALEATFPASDALALPLGAASARPPAPVPPVTSMHRR